MAKMRKELVMLVSLSAIGGFLFGYDTGVVSGAMLLIEDDDRIDANTLWKQLIVSSTVGAAWLFSLVGGVACERLGRKPVILAASVVFTIGAIVMGAAVDRVSLLVGRIIVGAGIGFASMSVPVYISEAAPPSLRGLLVSTNTLVITFGQFAAACVCGAFAGLKPDGWKYMLGLSGVPSLLQLIGFAFMPESPRWLAAKGKVDAARAVLHSIRDPDENPEEELRDILRAVEDERKYTNKSGFSLLGQVLRTATARRALVLGCLLQFYQQLAGINTVMYYSAKIISMAGVSDDTTAIWLSAAVASVNFLCTFIGLYFVERVGRRKLMLASLLGATASLAILAVGFQVTSDQSPLALVEEMPPTNSSFYDCGRYSSCGGCSNNGHCGFCYETVVGEGSGPGNAFNGSCVARSEEDPDNAAAFGRCSNITVPELRYAADYCPSSVAWLVVLGLCAYLFFFAPGMGPMPWTINSEIHPLWARSTSNAVATSVNWAANMLVSMTFLSLTEAITKEGTFYLYTGVALSGFFVFLWLLPETKGRGLEEMELVFEKPWSCPPEAARCCKKKRLKKHYADI